MLESLYVLRLEIFFRRFYAVLKRHNLFRPFDDVITEFDCTFLVTYFESWIFTLKREQWTSVYKSFINRHL
jgi:hypothetical protein